MTDNGVTKHIVPMNIIKIDGEYIPNPKAKVLQSVTMMQIMIVEG